ncbi:cyclin-like protein [Nitzschia inconspicua]|uniref:Cyclin-like protein n=1 Tax=Nitzschia inconspicua TaxID=303405 RepID=A0A9K3L1C6_9STRA|nr:cyclin-like protein [Nitzschia inconspicua]
MEANRKRRYDELSLRAPLTPKSGSVIHLSPNKLPPVTFLFRMFVACNVLEVSPETRFTAIVLLYRYAHADQGQPTLPKAAGASKFSPPDKKDWPWIGGACLFLACKTEEENRRLRDIINMIYMILTDVAEDKSGEKSLTWNCTVSGGGEKIPLRISTRPPVLNDDYWNAKKQLIETEQAVLRWLGFDCYVTHPHRAVTLILQEQLISLDSSPNPHCNITVTKAFQHLNDALFSPKALQFGVLELACASIEMALEDIDMMPNHNNVPGQVKQLLQPCWWRKYHVSKELLMDCKEALAQAKTFLKHPHKQSPD